MEKDLADRRRELIEAHAHISALMDLQALKAEVAASQSQLSVLHEESRERRIDRDPARIGNGFYSVLPEGSPAAAMLVLGDLNPTARGAAAK